MKENLWNKIKWCWRYTKEDIYLVLFSFLLSLSLAYINTLEPLYTGTLIDDLIISDFRSFIIKLIKLFLLQGLGIIISICVGKISLIINKRSTIRGERIVFSHVINRENNDWIQGHKAEVLNNLQNDVSILLGMWTNVIPGAFTSIFTLCVVSFRLLTINIIAFVLTIILSIIPFVVHHFAGKKELVLNTEAKKCGDSYVLSVQDLTSMCYESVGVSKLLFLNSFVNKIKDSFHISYKKFNLSQKYRLLLFIINIVTVSIIYFFLGYGIMIGRNSVGDFMVAILYSQQIRSLIQSYGSLYQSILAKSVSIDRVKKIIEINNKRQLKVVSDGPFISVKDIVFSYGNQNVFDNFSFCIKGAGIYVIKGKNGSGKTTLLKILGGMTDRNCLKKGIVTIGGIKGEEEIAYIPSKPYIASFSVKDNLLLGFEKEEADILKVIKKVGLIEWLNTLPDGLDTMFNPKTMGLSQGQMIRFSIASNLLRERKIYLIDEVEDGIDTESRTLILSMLEELAFSKIVVVVSHSSLFDRVAKSIIEIE